MAKQTLVTLIDDIDGSTAALTVNFTFQGAGYEIDLSAEHAAEFQAAVQPYIDAARRTPRYVSSTPASRDRRRRENGEYDPKAVREWARAQGIPTQERGRVSAELIAAYRAAH